MILGLGIDVVEVARIRRLVGEGAPAGTAERFLARCFTEGERRFCDARADRATPYAARFAAKEAAVKALGAPPGVRWTDVEVERDGGAPRLRLAGAAARAAGERGVTRVHLSLTHDAGVAAAVVVLEGGGT
ncbi:MAG TPA: holo-ACP synthase [Anaeromyxobacteraceae bacterium]|nr:holo-ACP synthase [Anaeromyxobacteraceae bacterium]